MIEKKELDFIVSVTSAMVGKMFGVLDYTVSHIVVSDRDYESMLLHGVEVNGGAGRPEIIPVSRLKIGK